MTNTKPSKPFTDAIERQIKIAQDTDHNSLARQLRAAANAVTSSDAAHINAAITALTAEMVEAEEGPNFVVGDADLAVVKKILITAASGRSPDIPIVPINPSIER